MDIDSRFPIKLNTINDAPKPFRNAFADNISSEESVNLLVYAPTFSTDYERLPATLLAVTDRGWLIASETEDGNRSVTKSDFNDTLFLELESIFLSGQFKVYFARVGTVYAANVTFNIVEEALYREAVNLILKGIDSTPTPPALNNRGAGMLFESWPIRFRLEAERYRPEDQAVLAAVQWPPIFSGFQREISPAGALLVSQRKLVLISELKSSPRQHAGDMYKFGGIITYFPIVRAEDVHLSQQERFGILALRVRAEHGAEKLEILIPLDCVQAVSKAMELIVRST